MKENFMGMNGPNTVPFICDDLNRKFFAFVNKTGLERLDTTIQTAKELDKNLFINNIMPLVRNHLEKTAENSETIEFFGEKCFLNYNDILTQRKTFI